MKLTLRVVGLVHGDKLVSDEIVASHQGSRDGGSPVQRVQDGITSPLSSILGTGNEALLVDLEPNFTSAIPAVAAGAWALGHVDQDRSGPVRPLYPVCFELVACSDGAYWAAA